MKTYWNSTLSVKTFPGADVETNRNFLLEKWNCDSSHYKQKKNLKSIDKINNIEACKKITEHVEKYLALSNGTVEVTCNEINKAIRLEEKSKLEIEKA